MELAIEIIILLIAASPILIFILIGISFDIKNGYFHKSKKKERCKMSHN